MRDTSLLSCETSEVAGYLSFNGELFVAEATAQDQEVQQAVAQRLEALRTANSELFRTEVSEFTAEVGAQILKATGDEDEPQSLQVVIGSFVATSVLDLWMSPKQFWQEYGARILGEPDVKRDAKGNLTEVQGKAPSQWKTDALKQSWGQERFKWNTERLRAVNMKEYESYGLNFISYWNNLSDFDGYIRYEFLEGSPGLGEDSNQNNTMAVLRHLLHLCCAS